MARFRDSASGAVLQAVAPTGAEAVEVMDGPPARARIGDILRQRLGLSASQVEQIAGLALQRRIRFGDAAVGLGHASTADVLEALAQQFQYPCAPRDRQGPWPERVMTSRPFSQQAEAIRVVRSQLMRHVFRGGAAGRGALAVVSPDPGDGKSFLAANLAIALAQVGGRTLLVDGDLRGPRQHEIFQLDNTVGLSAFLAARVAQDGRLTRGDEGALAEGPSLQAVGGVPGLWVLPVGVTPPNPLELIEQPAFGQLIDRLAGSFDHVVIDTPAVRYGADAQAIADRCGAALLVARRHASRLAALEGLIAAFAQGPARVVGAVMNEF